jgi:hypothetical protein
MQYATEVNDAKMNAIIDEVGPQPILKMFEGEKPTNCKAADPDGLLVELELPDEWMNRAFNGAIMKKGDWIARAAAEGTASSYRIYNREGQCKLQGNIGDGELDLDNPFLVKGQTVTIHGFTLAAGNR